MRAPVLSRATESWADRRGFHRPAVAERAEDLVLRLTCGARTRRGCSWLLRCVAAGADGRPFNIQNADPPLALRSRYQACSLIEAHAYRTIRQGRGYAGLPPHEALIRAAGANLEGSSEDERSDAERARRARVATCRCGAATSRAPLTISTATGYAMTLSRSANDFAAAQPGQPVRVVFQKSSSGAAA